MIIGKIHPGSGLGDQLFSYIITRVIALDKGYDFGFVGKEYFKGKDFLNLDWGKENSSTYHIENGGKLVLDIEGIDYSSQYGFKGVFVFDKPYYDPEVNFIEDGTIIDGTGAQDERYWGHRLDEIREWLKVKPYLDDFDSVCLVNFRGGEYALFPELFLTKEYWDKAMSMMREKYPDIEFIIHTDDKELARQFFPGCIIISGIEENWRALRQAKHLIISNSAFAILPAILGDAKEILAPRYWARRNIKQWSMPSNYYKKFNYL